MFLFLHVINCDQRKTSLLTKKDQVNVPKVKAQKVSAESSEKETDVNAIQIDRIVVSQLQSFSKKGLL